MHKNFRLDSPTPRPDPSDPSKGKNLDAVSDCTSSAPSSYGSPPLMYNTKVGPGGGTRLHESSADAELVNQLHESSADAELVNQSHRVSTETTVEGTGNASRSTKRTRFASDVQVQTFDTFDNFRFPSSPPRNVPDLGSEDELQVGHPVHSAHKQPQSEPTDLIAEGVAPDVHEDDMEADEDDMELDEDNMELDDLPMLSTSVDEHAAAKAAKRDDDLPLEEEDDEYSVEYEDDDEIIGPVPESSQDPSEPEHLEPAVQQGNKYAKLLTISYRDMLRAVWEDEREKRSALDSCRLGDWLKLTTQIMCTLTGPMLNAIICGNISKAYHQKEEPVASQIGFYKVNCANRPSIYNIMLVDKNGNAPSAGDHLRILHMMREYARMGVQSDQDAAAIDGARMRADRRQSRKIAPPPAQLSGNRRYLQRDNNTSVSRQAKILQFCDALEQRMEDVDDKMVPLARPLQYFGYSKDSGDRIAQHLGHNSSNPIMGLTEACAIYLHETKSLKKLYRLDAFPICVLGQPSWAVPAEIIFSCIGDGYITSGGGFAHHSAGESNDSVNSVPYAQWSKHCSFILKNTPYNTNMAREMKSLRVEYEERKKLEAEIAYWDDIIAREPEIRRDYEKALKEWEEVRPIWLQYKEHGIWFKTGGRRELDVRKAFERINNLDEHDDMPDIERYLSLDPDA
ncbi:hypothetical protein SLS55_008690 [Diplodia seriata]|uniref:Uncharacterized protein n=1 Tax=Diplodia seriata TaxID=420778 RepID=A0ABR3C6N4_9PEZI